MSDIASIRRQLSERGYLRHMAPPLAEAQLAEIEARYEVALPREYRAFLKEIGMCGPGPHYGLLSFGEALDYDRRLWGDEVPTSHLATPFPHTASFNPVADHERAGERVDKGEISEEECARIVHSSTHGTLGLAHQGCAYYDILVVTGPARGTVWVDGSDAGQGLHPLGIGFFEWYQAWLDGKVETMWTPADFAGERQSRPCSFFEPRKRTEG